MSWQTLGLRGDEQVTIRGLQGEIKPRQRMIAEIVAADGELYVDLDAATRVSAPAASPTVPATGVHSPATAGRTPAALAP